MSGSDGPSARRLSPAAQIGNVRAGRAHAARRWLAAACVALTTLGAAAGSDDAAGAQTTVAPVLSCGGGMALHSGSGQCLTPRTETALRPSGCPAASAKVPGQYGGHVCQTKVTKRVDTGRTKQVYSHTTYDKVWVPTGAKRVQTGTSRDWVPSRTVTEPLVPPVRVQTGTRTESKTVTRPGPDVLYPVSYQAEIRTKRSVRRCSFDPMSGRQCWRETVPGTRTVTRTRLECCIPGPPVTTTVTTKVPVYSYRTTHSVTIPGYWRETPVYEMRDTGYWDRIGTRHYTDVPVYETVVEWVTAPASSGPCPRGWQPAGSQCSRTVLGPPSAAPTQACPSGSVPRYGDALGGTGTSVLTCQSSSPGSNTDTGTEQEDGGGPEGSADGRARSLLHLAGESDERLAELGIHRCSNGLLSYVPCSELPGRTWNDDPDACDGIEGTVYRPDHGGSCVTPTDVLNKCTTPGRCEHTTIRTYCPAIGELADTRLEEHVHPRRGAETYRVCRFDCSDFGTLPSYVRTRIYGSYDYACLPEADPDDDPVSTTTTQPSATTTTSTTTVTSTTVTSGGSASTEPTGTAPADTVPGGTTPTGTAPTGTVPADTTPATVPSVGAGCDPTPASSLARATSGALVWASNIRSSDSARRQQRSLPGAGRYLQTAPGHGWMQVSGSLDIADGECAWVAAAARATWRELVPWVRADRAEMAAHAEARHLVARWDALNADQQQLTRQWHRSAAVRGETECTIAEASGAGAAARCGWVLRHSSAYRWSAHVCYRLDEADSPIRRRRPVGDDCWIATAAGVEWIRSLGEHAGQRITRSGAGSAP